MWPGSSAGEDLGQNFVAASEKTSDHRHENLSPTGRIDEEQTFIEDCLFYPSILSTEHGLTSVFEEVANQVVPRARSDLEEVPPSVYRRMHTMARIPSFHVIFFPSAYVRP